MVQRKDEGGGGWYCIVNLSPGEMSNCLHFVGDILHGVSLNYMHTYTYIYIHTLGNERRTISVRGRYDTIPSKSWDKYFHYPLSMPRSSLRDLGYQSEYQEYEKGESRNVLQSVCYVVHRTIQLIDTFKHQHRWLKITYVCRRGIQTSANLCNVTYAKN